MRIGNGKGCTRRKPIPVPLCPPQIPYLGSNGNRRGGKPAISSLIYGTASTISETSHIKSTLKRLIAQEALTDYDRFRSWSILLFKRWWARISARAQYIRIFLSLSSIIRLIMSRPLPSKSFPIHHSTLCILATDSDVKWRPPPAQKKRDI
jgi:hypothetical protein